MQFAAFRFLRNRNMRLGILELEWIVGGSCVFSVDLGNHLSIPLQGQVVGLSFTPLSDTAAAVLSPKFRIVSPKNRMATFQNQSRWLFSTVKELELDTLLFTFSTPSANAINCLPPEISKIGVLHSVDPELIEFVARHGDAFDRIVSISLRGLDLLRSLNPGFENRHLHLPPGILMPDDSYRRPRAPNDCLRILYLGRVMQPIKRVWDSVRLSEWLNRIDLPFHMTIAGNGPEVEPIRSWIHDHSLRNVSLLGPVARSQLADLFSKNDVFFSPSEREAFPLAIQEGIAHGLVPIAANVPGRLAEAVEQAGGFLAPPGDIDGFGRTCRELFDNRASLPCLSHAASKSISTELGWEPVADRWLRMLEASARGVQSVDWHKAKYHCAPVGPLHYAGSSSFLVRSLYACLAWIESLTPNLAKIIRRASYQCILMWRRGR